jgi:histo-blood group ABO system transferase
MKFIRIAAFIAASSILHCLHAYKIGLCIMATGRYDAYAERFIESARNYFLKEHEVTYFVFTDGTITPAPDVVTIHQKRLGWPQDTLMRFSVYGQHQDAMKDMDYIFASDADMLFVAPVEGIILGKRIATRHPGYVGRRGTYETNRNSAAYVAPHEGAYYFAGGFYGAEREEFFAMMDYLTKKIESDLQNNYIAIWHDESHLNRYFIDFKPTVILEPTYCCPETTMMPGRKLLALDKDHAKMRR